MLQKMAKYGTLVRALQPKAKSNKNFNEVYTLGNIFLLGQTKYASSCPHNY